MGYDRLGSVDPGSSQLDPITDQLDEARSRPPGRKGRPKLKLFLIFSATFILSSAVSAAILLGLRTRSSGGSKPTLQRKPTVAISRACSLTRCPTLCVDSLLKFPGWVSAVERDLVHISVNVTLQRFGKAFYVSSEISNLHMKPHVRAAYDDCIDPLDDSVYQISRSLTSVAGGGRAGTQVVMTWLSAALTNHDTCLEGLAEVSGYVKDHMQEQLRDLSELVSNCLAIFAAASQDKDFAGVPIQNRSRRLMGKEHDGSLFPEWLSRRDRRLLDMPAPAIQADIVVSKDGNGTGTGTGVGVVVKTIAEAIKKAPEYSNLRSAGYQRGKTAATSRREMQSAVGVAEEEVSIGRREELVEQGKSS